MFILLPILWIVAWIVIAGLIAAFSGLSPHGWGLPLFFGIFGVGGIGLPLVGGLGWLAVRRLRDR